MIWSAFLHIYQPPWQKPEMVKKIARQSYWRIVHILEKNPKAKITLNINAGLTEQLMKLGYEPLIKAICHLASRGQIEFTGSAKYHTILPFLPKSEIIRQIQLNNKTNKKYFGLCYKPKGFFPPEMCWKPSLAPIIKSLGFDWVILDEIAINPQLKSKGYSQSVCFDGSAGLHFFFRSRKISDLFSTMVIKSAEHFMSIVNKEMLEKEMLITAFDGENLGHHSPNMDNRFEEIIKYPHIRMLTHSELFEVCSYHQIASPKSSSWSTRPDDMKKNIPFPLWRYPGNDLHKIQWQIYNYSLKEIVKYKQEKGWRQARLFLDQALSSDQFWWASACPWWGTEEAYTGTELFLKAINCLPKMKVKPFHDNIEKKLLTLKQHLEYWQNTGKFDKIKKAFLNHEKFTHYFGGEKVK